MMFVPHRKHRTLLSVTRSYEKEEEEREVGSSERHYGWGEQNISSVLEVPRHCPFVLCYEDSFTLLYVDDVRTSQETPASTASYMDSFTGF
jgi:hypothetical protein